MKLIVGLGNPDDKYRYNRHNVGFMFVEFFNKNISNPNNIFKYDKYLESEIIQLKDSENNLILAKPQTYMNKSGIAVNKIIKKFNIAVDELIVVHDDLDIPLGKMHIQVGVGPQLHNGLESIEHHLKTKTFTRVRIGVDARVKDKWINGETYVLQNFLTDEKTLLEDTVFPRIMELLKHPH